MLTIYLIKSFIAKLFAAREKLTPGKAGVDKKCIVSCRNAYIKITMKDKFSSGTMCEFCKEAT
jgi:hypothetical protein